MEKWPFLGLKPWVNPLEKSQFLDFLNVFFYSLEMRFFILKYFKTHFSCLYCLKKGGKIAICGPKPWVNPFGKIFIFRLFENLVLIAEKGFFRSRIL